MPKSLGVALYMSAWIEMICLKGPSKGMEVALYMTAWIMMEQPPPGRMSKERRFIRNKEVR
ncbi:hypothetical protein [Paenibacillus peoriae]|uniref:hypothetical protein n=1 Tax=Paenibacillus peoriae TaxID=59893 RepID=UPI00215A6FC6|nr:hypothetical protein [Paenibacillus peoriae]